MSGGGGGAHLADVLADGEGTGHVSARHVEVGLGRRRDGDAQEGVQRHLQVRRDLELMEDGQQQQGKQAGRQARGETASEKPSRGLHQAAMAMRK